MSLEPRDFRRQDRTLADSLSGEAKSCLQTLFNRNHPLFVLEPKYGEKVWVERKLQVVDARISFKQPIGLVVRGVLEVTERFVCGEIERRRTTAILHPGQFFGLFEALGDLRGFWEVTAGVQRFLITNPLGNALTLRRRGWKDVGQQQLRTLQHRKEADFDYSDFVRFALSEREVRPNAASAWPCTIVLFDLHNLLDSEALLDLLRAAVRQLSSLARQNPPDALFARSPRRNDTADHLRVGATLDAILADHIPVFSLYTADHEPYGPFKQMIESLRMLAGPRRNEVARGSPYSPPIHLWIPDYWSRVKAPGALYIDALTRKFDMKSADELLKVGTAGRMLRSGTSIKAARNARGETDGLLVCTDAGTQAVIHRLAVRRQQRIPSAFHEALFPADTQPEFRYGWPPHLGGGFFMRPV